MSRFAALNKIHGYCIQKLFPVSKESRHETAMTKHFTFSKYKLCFIKLCQRYNRCPLYVYFYSEHNLLDQNNFNKSSKANFPRINLFVCIMVRLLYFESIIPFNNNDEILLKVIKDRGS